MNVDSILIQNSKTKPKRTGNYPGIVNRRDKQSTVYSYKGILLSNRQRPVTNVVSWINLKK